MTRPSKKPKHRRDIPVALTGRVQYSVHQVASSKFDILKDGHFAEQKGNEQAAIRLAIKYQKQENE